MRSVSIPRRPEWRLLSVFDERSGLYDYYSLGNRIFTYRPTPRSGVLPLQVALPKLPREAKWIGRGRRAKGVIVRTPSKPMLGKKEALALGVLGAVAFLVPRI